MKRIIVFSFIGLIIGLPLACGGVQEKAVEKIEEVRSYASPIDSLIFTEALTKGQAVAIAEMHLKGVAIDRIAEVTGIDTNLIRTVIHAVRDSVWTGDVQQEKP